MRRNRTIVIALVVSVLGLASMMLPQLMTRATAGSGIQGKSKGGGSQGGEAKGGEVKGPGTGMYPEVVQAVGFGVTAPVKEMKEAQPDPNKASFKSGQQDREVKNEELVKLSKSFDGPTVDGAMQSGLITEPTIPGPALTFDGLSSDQNQTAFGFRVMPPDTVGDVGPNHYVQATNLLVRIFNKNGTPATAPFKLSSLFTGVTGAPCDNVDDGDPIVLYDPLADRWMLSQFCTIGNPNTHQLIAISTTGDPTGTYFVYDFPMPNDKFNDYPHFGVWPDAYYMTDNQFNQAGTAFLGAGAFAFDRKKLLAGDPTATFIYFDLFLLDPTLGGQLPTDIDGYVPPPVGTPNLFMEFRATEFGDPADALRIFEFRPNFSNPGASTFTQLTDLPLAAFDARQPSGRADIEQPPPATSGTFLDAIPDRLMHRLAYRNLGSVSSAVNSYVLNFSVNVSGVNPTNAATYQTGIRFTELRRSGAGVMSVFDQGTFAPGAIDPVNGINRWMGSIAQDNQGNIAVGYSASSLTLFPTIRWAGRTGAPSGTLNEGEADMFAGTGSQRGPNRWGDYSSMNVDPADDCTFWYTTEYYTAASSAASTFGWLTRIGNFKFPGCTAALKGAFSGVVTNCSTGAPIDGATVTTTDGFLRVTSGGGNYSVTAAPGTYNVTASKTGFGQGSGTVTVTNGGNAILNLCLAPTAIITSGGATLVTEGCSPANGAIDPGETVTVSFCVTNTGSSATSNLVGTLSASGGVTNPSGPQNYGMVAINQTVCRNFTFTASGTCGGTITASIQFQDGATNLGTVTYTFTLGSLNTVLTQNFDGVTAPALPAGWTATIVTGPAGTANWVTSSAGTPAPPADTAPNAAFVPDPAVITDVVLDTPTIAITSNAAQLTFRNNFELEDGFDGGVLEISIGGGPFVDIITAGGSFVSGGYTGTISTAFGSPIGGRNAWEGDSNGFITTRVNLPAAAAGQNVKLRFRKATDSSVSFNGWRVDTVSLTDGFVCCVSNAVTPCAENFDGVTAPALPADWTATTAIDCANSNPWATTTTNPNTPPNAAFVNDPNCISDERLDSRLFPIISSTAQLTFQRANNLENGFDGAVLEISSPNINGGAFTDILAAGGSFVTGGYNGTISVNFGNPLAGRQAWTGSTGGPAATPNYVMVTVNLPASVNGQSIRLRFRRGTDSSVSGTGIWIDTLAISGSNCGGVACDLTCPANITQSNDPNQCGAVVNYPSPTVVGTCGTVTCSPSSGSFFPKGTTTVTCTGTGDTCSFTVTVVDTQPPTITCPSNVITAAAPACPPAANLVVNYPPPTATDNCPMVTTACVPPSGTALPPGTTTVTCTATDMSGNTATCSFTITVFDVCLQDDSNPATVLLINTQTGQYIFSCNGTQFTGTGKITGAACSKTLEHNPTDRRVRATFDTNTKRGNASLQVPAGTPRCNINDSNMANNTCAVGGGGPPTGRTK